MRRNVQHALLLFFLTLVCGSSWATDFQTQDIQIPVTRFTLDNGLTVVVSEDHKAPIVAVNVTYRVGSRNEPKGRRGFAHLFEHLLFQGSENFNDDFFKATEKLGATDLNGTTWFDRTNYFQTVPANALDSILWLESDRMGHFAGAITQDRLDEQRNVVLNEMKQGLNTPYRGVLQDNLQPSLYPAGHPYSWSTIGSKEDLKAATLEDVKQWFEDYYGPNNAILTIVGDVTVEEARKKAIEYFGSIAPSKKPYERRTWIAPRNEPKRDVAFDRVPLPRIYMYWNIPGFGSKAMNTFDVLKSVLTSGKNGLFYKTLVLEKELASDITAFIYPLQLGGVFAVQATAKPGVALEDLEKGIRDIFQSIAKKGVGKKHLETVKTQEYVYYMNQMEKIGGFSGKTYLLSMFELLTGNAENYLETFEAFLQTDSKDIQEAVQEWIFDRELAIEIHPLPAYQTTQSDVSRKTLPLPKDELEITFPKIQTTQLQNGVVLKHIQRDSIPQLEGLLWMEGGSALDPQGKAGLTALVMDLINERTKKYDALSLEQALSELGSSVVPYCDMTDHGISFSSLEQHVSETLKLAKQMLEHPKFTQEDFDRVMKQTQEALQKRMADPRSLSRMLYTQKLFGPKHPLGHNISGNQTSLQNISRADVEKAYPTTIHPSRLRVFTIGAMSIEDVKAKFDDAIGDWKKDNQPKSLVLPVKKQEPTTIYIVDLPGVVQTAIAAGYVLERTAPRQNMLTQTVFDVLSNNFTSRLNMNLREDKSWTYGTYSRLSGYDDQFVYRISGSIQSDKTVEAMEEIYQELQNIKRRNPITQKELETVINRNVLSLAGNWETNHDVLSYMVSQFQNGYPDDYLSRYPNLLRSVTLDQVQDKTKETVLPARMTWILVGDAASWEKKLSQKKWGNIIRIAPDGSPLNPKM